MRAEFATRELVLKAIVFIRFSSLVARRAYGWDTYLRPHYTEAGETGGLSGGTGWGQGGAARGKGPSRPCSQTGRAAVGPARALRSRVGGPGAPGSSAGVSSALSCMPKGRRSLSPPGTPTIPGPSPRGLSWHKEEKPRFRAATGRGPLRPPTSRKTCWPEMVPNPPPHRVPATFYRGPPRPRSPLPRPSQPATEHPQGHTMAACLCRAGGEQAASSRSRGFHAVSRRDHP